MINTDRFVVAVHDQLQKHWVQRRVTMRDTWVTMPLVGKPQLIPITAVLVKDGWQQHLADSIRGRYVGARHWKDRGPDLVDRILAVEGDHLADINLKLMGVVREILDIRTEIVVTEPPVAAGIDRVLEQLQVAGATSYLSGTGARGYIDAEAEQKFRDLGIDLVWSNHHRPPATRWSPCRWTTTTRWRSSRSASDRGSAGHGNDPVGLPAVGKLVDEAPVLVVLVAASRPVGAHEERRRPGLARVVAVQDPPPESAPHRERRVAEDEPPG